MCPNPADLLLGLLAILFPPLAVWIKRGLCSADSLINIALCLLGFLPGLLHAWYIIAVTPDAYQYEAVEDVEDQPGAAGYQSGPGGFRPGSVSYYYVSGTPNAPGQQFGAGAPGNQHSGYGSMGPSSGGNLAGAGTGGVAEEVPPAYAEAIKGDNKVQRA